MAYRVKWLGGNLTELEITRQTQPEFYHLYQSAVLLCLREQDVLDENQVQWCLEQLGDSWEVFSKDQ